MGHQTARRVHRFAGGQVPGRAAAEHPRQSAALPVLPQVVVPALAVDNAWGAGGGEIVEERHEMAANGRLVAAAAHVPRVVLAPWRHRETLGRAMVTGETRAPGCGDPRAPGCGDPA